MPILRSPAVGPPAPPPAPPVQPSEDLVIVLDEEVSELGKRRQLQQEASIWLAELAR